MDGIKLSSLKKNPNNPRLIKDKAFKKLVNNILSYPHFLSLRPLVHQSMIIYGGNQRLEALNSIVRMKANEFNDKCVELDVQQSYIEQWQEIRKTKAIPAEWVKDGASLSADELKAFIILDNRDFGEDDLDKLANEWNIEDLNKWNVDLKDWLPTEETEEVSFKVRKPGEDYTTFEQLMHIKNKRRLTETLDEVKNKQKLNTLEEALMYLVEFYDLNKRE